MGCLNRWTTVEVEHSRILDATKAIRDILKVRKAA